MTPAFLRAILPVYLLLILWSAAGILLESSPRDLDMSAMVSDNMQVPGVPGVHDLHVWSITRGLRSMSAHLRTADVPISQGAAIQAQVNRMLALRYRISHATLQLECVGCEPDLLYCDINGIDQAHVHGV
jgi:cobalt-zinc-cadmium efflux system protein